MGGPRPLGSPRPLGRLRALLGRIDQRLTPTLAVARERGPFRTVALGIAHSGDIYVWAALLVAAWLLGDHAWRVRAVVACAGLALAEGVVILVKTVVRRKRPPGDAGAIYRRADPYSFPSGHAARAMLLCILAGVLGPAWAFWSILAWSPIMVASRVAIAIHYVLDVAGGLVLGVALAAVVLGLAPVMTSWI